MTIQHFLHFYVNALFTVIYQVFKQEHQELNKKERTPAVIFKDQLCISSV